MVTVTSETRVTASDNTIVQKNVNLGNSPVSGLNTVPLYLRLINSTL